MKALASRQHGVTMYISGEFSWVNLGEVPGMPTNFGNFTLVSYRKDIILFHRGNSTVRMETDLTPLERALLHGLLSAPVEIPAEAEA
jgi:hypothetical protein